MWHVLEIVAAALGLLDAVPPGRITVERRYEMKRTMREMRRREKQERREKKISRIGQSAAVLVGYSITFVAAPGALALIHTAPAVFFLRR